MMSDEITNMMIQINIHMIEKQKSCRKKVET